MTAKDVGAWMAKKLDEEDFLSQGVAVYEIQEKFGEDFVYINDRGTLSISLKVLEEFGKLTKDTVVWQRRARMWRKREDFDPTDKRQAD